MKRALVFFFATGLIFTYGFASSAFGTIITDFAIYGDARVKLGDRVTVIGDVGSGGKVKVGKDVEVKSDVHFNVPSIAIPSATPFSAGVGNISKGKGESTTLAPGYYKNMKLGKENTLYLSTGSYYFNKISIDKELDLFIDLSRGAIDIFAVGTVSFGKDLDVSIMGADAEAYTGFSNADKSLSGGIYVETRKSFKLESEGEWFGTVFAPEGNISFGDESNIIGALYSGADVKLGKESTLDFVLADRFQTETQQIAHQPEPATMLLLGAGLVGLGILGRKKFIKRG